MANTKRKRRPRWGRILGALLFLGLCVGLSIGLARLLTEQPEDLDATGGDSTSGGLQVSANPGGGQVLSFTDPGVSLTGLQAGEASDGSCVYLAQQLAVDDPTMSQQALACFDYTTKTLDWLCDVPGCDHTSPECTAWLPPNSYSSFSIDGDNLYLTIRDFENDVTTFTRCDLDGGNRTEILQVEGHSILPLHNEAVTVLIVEKSSVESLVYVYDKATGSCQQYMTMKHYSVPWSCEYVYDHFLTVTAPGKTENSTTYLAVDLATGQERTLCELVDYDDDRRFVRPVQDNGFLYYLRDKSGESCDFVRQSIAAGEEIVLNDTVFFPDNYTAAGGASLDDGCYSYGNTAQSH